MLNQASLTRSPVGRTVRPAGAFRRRPLNSPAIMRSKTRHPGLNGRPPLPVIPLQPKSDVEWVREPVLRHLVSPAEADRRKQTRAVVEREPQVVRPNAARANCPRIPHAEHRRRIPRPARLQMPNQPFQVRVHRGERQLEIDALARREVFGGQKLARDGEERNAEVVKLVAPDREPGCHRVAAVFLEMRPHSGERAMQIEPCNAAARARSEEHTSELQSLAYLVCRLLLEK